MMELELVLELACCCCRQPMGVTVRCAGKGLAAGSRARAAVTAPCPNCSNLVKIVFAPDGTLHHVSPHEMPKVPQPSLN